MGRKNWRRWGPLDHFGDEEETDISIEEQLTLEDHEHRPDETGSSCDSNGLISQATQLTLNGARIHRGPLGNKRNCGRPSSSGALRWKMQLLGTSVSVLLGFIAGFCLALRSASSSGDGGGGGGGSNINPGSPSISSPAMADSLSASAPQTLRNELNESVFHKVVLQISGENIRHNLKRMTQELHSPGTKEGRSMAFAIRDLWRSYGLLGVRVEQHKATLTRTNNYNYLQVFGGNNSSHQLLFETSRIPEDPNLPASIPIIAFSPGADFNGSLVYGHFGRFEDFSSLESSQIALNGSIALVRYSNIHPSKVALTASVFGVRGILFYPDPAEYGPKMPQRAIIRASAFTLGQIHEYQKQRDHPYAMMGMHTISYADAEQLLRLMKNRSKAPEGPLLSPSSNSRTEHPQELVGRLRVFNEEKSSSIFNVVAAIPGLESDRYIIVGASHDSWTAGAGDPGISLAILTEIARVFAVSVVSKGWKPRRSILFISWDGNLYGASGVYHWMQEHHFEIVTRTVAYVDLTRILQGNQTLSVFSSPILKEVARRAIQKIKHFEMNQSPLSPPPPPPPLDGGSIYPPSLGTIQFSTFLPGDEPSFAFLGNGIPFIRFSLTNAPKDFDYPLFGTAFDTFDNFVQLVDPTFTGSETLGRIISGLVVLLADSPILPLNVEDYVEEIQKSFGNFMSHYQEDLHRSNISIGYLQASVMRLEVIGDNFRTEVHNRSVIVNNEEHESHPENDHFPPSSDSSPHNLKSRKSLFHRIINDKMMNLERALLSQSSNVYKHTFLGYSRCTKLDYSVEGSNSKCSVSFDNNLPRLKELLECGRWSPGSSNEVEDEDDQYLESDDDEKSELMIQMEAEESESEEDPHYLYLNYEGVENSKSRHSHSSKSRKRSGRKGESDQNTIKNRKMRLNYCFDHINRASQEITSLIRCLDAASAILQSPLLPEESDSSSS